jgi:predicted enzyme related to lactoylglutathione lyase
MSTAEEAISGDTLDGTVANVDLKLEAIVIPVSDVDRAKAYYGRLGWRLDADFCFDNGVKIVQFTPPGSPASVQFGTKMTAAAPGSAENLYLIVSDIEAARDQLVPRGAQVSEVFHRFPRRAVSAGRHEPSPQRTRARSPELRVVRNV